MQYIYQHFFTVAPRTELRFICVPALRIHNFACSMTRVALLNHISRFLDVDLNQITDFHRRIELFTTNNGSDVMYIVANGTRAEVLGDSTVPFNLEFGILVVIIKPKGVFSVSDLYIWNVPLGISGNESFEGVRSLLSLGLVPYFESVVSESHVNLGQTLGKTRLKFNELSLALQHLQQTIEIPDLVQSAHPAIRNISGSQEANLRHLAEDPEILNQVNNIVISWVRQIKNVTTLDHSPQSSESIIDHFHFWKSMDLALKALQHQMKSPEVRYSLQVLNFGKRQRVVTSFENDTGLEEALARCKTINDILKDIPIEEVLSISGQDDFAISKLEAAIQSVFTYLRRLKNHSNFSTSRSVDLVTGIANEIVTKILHTLRDKDILELDITPFDDLIQQVRSTLNVLDESIKSIVELLRELSRKRDERFSAIKVDQSSSSVFKERLTRLSSLHHQHEELLQAFYIAYKESDNIHLLRQAWNHLKSDADPFDITKKGSIFWESNEKIYMESYRSALHDLQTLYSARYHECNDTSQMAMVLSEYSGKGIDEILPNLLLDADKIKILQVAHKEVERLQEIHSKIGLSMSRRVHESDMIPALNMRRGLLTRADFIKGVLRRAIGNWEHYSIGSRLENDLGAFVTIIDPVGMFQNWLTVVKDQILPEIAACTQAKILRATKNELKRELVVALDESIVMQYNNFQEFSGLGLEMPLTVHKSFTGLSAVLSIATSINESLDFMKEVLEEYGESLGDNESILLKLLVKPIQEVFEKSSKLSTFRWFHFQNFVELNEFAFSGDSIIESQAIEAFHGFQKLVQSLHEKFVLFKAFNQRLQSMYDNLERCEYTQKSIEQSLNLIQLELQKVALYDSQVITILVAQINHQVSEILARKSQAMLSQLGHSIQESHRSLFEHTASFEEKSVVINPPLASTKAALVSQINDLLQVVERQNQISSEQGTERKNYVVSRALGDSIGSTLSIIDRIIDDADNYVKLWIAFLNLWDLDVQDKSESNVLLAGVSSFKEWNTLLKSVSSSATILETSSYEKGCMAINFSRILPRAQLRFDKFYTNFLSVVSSVLQSNLSLILQEVESSITVLESSFEHKKSFESKLVFIKFILEVELKVVGWGESYKLAKDMNSTLTAGQYKEDTQITKVDPEQLNNRLSVVKSLRKLRLSQAMKLTDEIRANIENAAQVFGDLVNSFKLEWLSQDTLHTAAPPPIVFEKLIKYKKEVLDLQELHHSYEVVATFVQTDVNLPDIRLLEATNGQIDDLITTWKLILGLWESFKGTKDLKWTSTSSLEVRQKLETILKASRDMSESVQQFDTIKNLQRSIKSFLKNFRMINDLKAGSLKNRHWRQIVSLLGMGDLVTEDITWGTILDLDLEKNKTRINSVLSQAAAELTLQATLDDMQAHWHCLTFSYYDFNGLCSLVRNGKELLDKCDQNVRTLSSMKSSTYYKVFEADATLFENRLNQFISLLGTFMEIQRVWVYLYGVFGQNRTEVRAILPIESTRFQNITYEFFEVLKKIGSQDSARSILEILNVSASFKEMWESLQKISRALNDFLEKQRDIFPRFYLIGNEDLLELMSGSRDEVVINKHIKKMFFGVSGLVIVSSEITEIKSDDNESLKLVNPISLSKYDRLIDWLKEFDYEVKNSLAVCTRKCLNEYGTLFESPDQPLVREFVLTVPGQVQFLVSKVKFTELALQSISAGTIARRLEVQNKLLNFLTAYSAEVDISCRRKLEHLIIEEVHNRDILISLKDLDSEAAASRLRTEQLFYFVQSDEPIVTSLKVVQGEGSFIYGFEYLGVPDKLAYTPLIDNCNFTMTQALTQKLGGAPFGPAGTGKTEAIKSLGYNLGQMVVLFCCDETFDFQAMSRLFVGICRLGCWGCFDEFNRLSDKILSAVSSQIEKIESSLVEGLSHITLTDKTFEVQNGTAIFITMNPGYAGRYELPENLKRLFVGYSMNEPDRNVIAEVLLSSRNFVAARELSVVFVSFLKDLASATTKQVHYDFGLRALKRCIDCCADLYLKTHNDSDKTSLERQQKLCVLQSLYETILPKLVKEDIHVFHKMVAKYFDGFSVDLGEYALIDKVETIAAKRGLVLSQTFIQKIVQFYQVQRNHQGVILVGRAASGKSVVQSLLQLALEELEGIESLTYVIECKILSKEELFGSLDAITRDWNDGLVTSILRRIRNNLRGELHKRIWIVFDGDVDPDWAENLNSVLDDNRILTLPNGERIKVPPNVRLIFEVANLTYATPATVTRCGMVYFHEGTVTTEMVLQHNRFNFETAIKGFDKSSIDLEWICEEMNESDNAAIIMEALEFSQTQLHVMEFDRHRAIRTFFIRLQAYFRAFLSSSDYYSREDVRKYFRKAFILSLSWAIAGDCSLKEKEDFSRFLVGRAWKQDWKEMGSDFICIDYGISLPNSAWRPWSLSVIQLDLQPQDVMSADTVIPTSDTLRHEDLIFSLINEHEPIILCGPPGSGKTMTVMEALRRSPNMDIIPINFSKDSPPQLLIKSLETHCVYKRLNNSLVLAPKVSGKWAVVFCDEINLPAYDKYGSQKIIAALRQLVEWKGFWLRNEWVKLQNIQFVGACNPSTDQGRNILPDRFLRHATVIMVDHPGETSLRQIYLTFNRALLNLAPNLKGFCNHLTEAMLDLYHKCLDYLPHQNASLYIYSPRELTRWCRGILVILGEKEHTLVSSLLRAWYHEGLRIFCDRLSEEVDRNWVMEQLKFALENRFPGLRADEVLKGPLLYSRWITLRYEEVSPADLVPLMNERFKLFGEEEKDMSLIVYDDLLDYVLRIDRVLRQPQGHMILVGAPASGRTTLCRFVAWMNGLKVFQLVTHYNYTLSDFEDFLRGVLRSCAKGEGVCLMIDECSVIDISFIERMNSILANAEAPGLYEGEDLHSLFSLCKEQSQLQGLSLETEDELFGWFRSEISANLHVIFTMSDSSRIISSPALLNRCILSWMGDWSNHSMFQIARDVIGKAPLDSSEYKVPETFSKIVPDNISSLYDVVADALVAAHRIAGEVAIEKGSSIVGGPHSPAFFVRLLDEFLKIYLRRATNLEEMQSHTTNGLNRLRGAVLEVKALKQQLSDKKAQLAKKDSEAKDTLNKLLTDQNEAERRQEFSVETQGALARQEKDIDERRKIVLADLADAEPAVLAAQKGVQNIKKQHLTELRSMANPPAAVKMTMESVCILLGYEVTSWRDVQSIIRKDDFIANIVNFDNEKRVTPDLLEYMERVYLSRADYSYEVVDRASKACGPLLAWVKAQLSYATILDKIEPLREEVRLIESHARKTKAQLIAIDQMIQELDSEIETLKEDYMLLIRETESIRLEMTTVENKMSRSLRLIESLNSEKDRWHSTIEKFGSFRRNLVGNSIISAAMVTYSGALSEQARQELVVQWKEKLRESGVSLDDGKSDLKALAEPDRKLFWKDCGLSQDELNIQNIIIFEEGVRSGYVPLLVDPEESILTFITSLNSPQKTVITSFLDPSYVTSVENALKFGTHILIKDAEFYNHNLDPILRKDFQRNGGRTVVKFNSNEVDVNPGFKLFIHTKDLNLNLSSFVTSRVLTVNFTISDSSLETQVLDLILKTFNPDIQIKRNEAISLQDKYEVLLHDIESDLLSSLNQADGRFLDNDTVVDSLEEIKNRAQDMDNRYQAASEVLKNAKDVCDSYSTTTHHVRDIFTAFTFFSNTSTFYNFSLSFLLQLFIELLKWEIDPKSPDFIRQLYEQAFKWISSTMTQQDRIAAAVILYRVYVKIAEGEKAASLYHKVLEAIKNGDQKGLLNLVVGNPGGESDADELQTNVLKIISGDSKWGSCSELLKAYIYHESSDLSWPDRVLGEMMNLGKNLNIHFFKDQFDFKDWVVGKDHQVYLLPSLRGSDATLTIERLARLNEKKLTIISMGTIEGTETADMDIEGAALSGKWILVQNGHMALHWLTTLPRKFAGLNLHPSFRLFITCSLSSTIPSALLMLAHVLMFETPPSLRSNVQVSVNLVRDMMDSESVSKAHRKVIFLLAWFHSIVLERLRYAQVNTIQPYDINDNTLLFGVGILKKTFNDENFQNQIPWDYIRYIIGTIVYGGLVVSSTEHHYITELAGCVFCEEALEENYSLIRQGDLKLPAPEFESTSQWFSAIPDQTPLAWLGLPEQIGLKVREAEVKNIAETCVQFK